MQWDRKKKIPHRHLSGKTMKQYVDDPIYVKVKGTLCVCVCIHICTYKKDRSSSITQLRVDTLGVE